MIILDTDHVSSYQWPASDARHVLKQRLDACQEPVRITIVTVEEQMRGWLAEIKRRTKPRRQIAAYGRLQFIVGFFAQWTILPWDEDACEIFSNLRDQKVRVGTMDLKIASIALSKDALLLTRNFRDFEESAEPSLRGLDRVSARDVIYGAQRITQWVTGGPYAAAIEVDAIFPVDDPSEPCLTPETVRFLEQVADWAEGGNVAALMRVGRVYSRMSEPAAV